jgi:hypothetical protein
MALWSTFMDGVNNFNSVTVAFSHLGVAYLVGKDLVNRSEAESKAASNNPSETAQAQENKGPEPTQQQARAETSSTRAVNDGEKSIQDNSLTTPVAKHQQEPGPEVARPTAPENPPAHRDNPEFQAEKQRALEEAERMSPPPPPPPPPPSQTETRTR